MLRIFLILIASILTVNAEVSLDRLIDALAIVESGGNPNAYNSRERAIGILQIRPIMVRDYNRISGSSISHADAWCPEVSRAIARTVLAHYGRHIEREEGRVTVVQLAAVWNGGPSAYKKIFYNENLQNYVDKVENLL